LWGRCTGGNTLRGKRREAIARQYWPTRGKKGRTRESKTPQRKTFRQASNDQRVGEKNSNRVGRLQPNQTIVLKVGRGSQESKRNRQT